METILYKRIKSQPNYFISELGDVYSLKRGIFLKLQKDKDGYVIIAFGKKKLKQHRLVCETFISEISEGFVVNHKDLNKANNSISNLEIVTPSQNTRHFLSKQVDGLSKSIGENHYHAKINLAIAMEIIKENPTKYAHQKELALKYGISDCLVRDIVKKRAWKRAHEMIENNQ